MEKQGQACQVSQTKEFSMDTAVDSGTLITRSPGIKAGRPRIAGTGVTVRRIVV